jgi:virginiamycin B lyase
VIDTYRFLLSGFLAIGSLAVTSCSGPSGGAAIPFAGEEGSKTSSRFARERVKVKEFADLPAGTSSGVSYTPSDVTEGPDGAIWVTDQIDQDSGENAVVRIATSGRRTNTYFYGGVTSEGSSLGSITTGPDGALWVTDAYNSEVLRLDLNGNYTRFPVGGYGSPVNIVTGPDKALWFTEQAGSASEVVRMTTKGAMTPYTVGGEPIDIAVGSDGALWFTDFSGHVGRITTHGKITEYSKGISPGAQPYSIAPGPDGALWFTELGGGRIGRITTAGKISEYSNGITPGERPIDLAAGPDGAMWFTEYELGQSYRATASKIGRVTMQGTIAEYSKINPSSAPIGIAKGLKGDLWFVEGSTNEVGRLRVL